MIYEIPMDMLHLLLFFYWHNVLQHKFWKILLHIAESE